MRLAVDVFCLIGLILYDCCEWNEIRQVMMVISHQVLECKRWSQTAAVRSKNARILWYATQFVTRFCIKSSLDPNNDLGFSWCFIVFEKSLKLSALLVLSGRFNYFQAEDEVSATCHPAHQNQNTPWRAACGNQKPWRERSSGLGTYSTGVSVLYTRCAVGWLEA